MHFNRILNKAAYIGLVAGILILLVSFNFAKQILGTWQLTKNTVSRLQITISSVDIYDNRIDSADLNTPEGKYYTICSESLNQLLIPTDDLKGLEGKTAEIWMDKFERVLQVVADDKNYIDFDAALTGQKMEDIFIFAIGVATAFVGIAVFAVSWFLLHRAKKQLQKYKNNLIL